MRLSVYLLLVHRIFSTLDVNLRDIKADYNHIRHNGNRMNWGMVSTLYTASVSSDRVVVSPTTGSQKPNAVHTMDVCYRPIEFRATMGSALNQYKVKREVRSFKGAHNEEARGNHREKHRYTHVLSLIVIKLRKIPLLFPSCYYDIIWASHCQNI
jgi:hypothetical protein